VGFVFRFTRGYLEGRQLSLARHIQEIKRGKMGEGERRGLFTI